MYRLMFELWHGAGATAARRRRIWPAMLLTGGAIVLAVSGVVSAVDDVEFHVERIDGAGWRARGIETSIALGAGATIANLRVARLELPGLDNALRDVRIECAHVDISNDAFACDQASIRFADVRHVDSPVRASVRYERRTGALDVTLPELRVGEGAASAKVALRGNAWTAELKLDNASMPALTNLARQFGVSLPAIAATSGLAKLSARARGASAEIREAAIEGRLTRLTFNNESGSMASDALALDIRGSLKREGPRSRFEIELRSSSGQAYAQPIFLDFGVHAAAVSAVGTIEGASVTIERFALDHTDVAKVNGAAALSFDEALSLRQLDARIESIAFPGAYESYLQPVLLDTSFKSMQTAGSLSGRVVFDAGAPQSIDLAFDRLAFEDADGRFGLSGLNGRWMWRNAADADADADDSPPALTSNLRWDGGVLLGLALGAADLKFATQGRQFRLLERARIPLLDGAIDFETLRARNIGAPKVAFLVDATIQPISVDRLCRAFGWPEFGGRIGGEISKLRMREGVVTLGTTLQAQVFDGAVRISDLRLEEPFAQWPRFHSSISLEHLDLELVTRAFSFGRITGRLSGDIRELELFNWTPVAFDARFYTPPADRSRRRISQRAVENIGSIGGSGAGVTAALSSGFLRFFDDFSYDRLGLSCRLANDVCYMNGVAPAPNGGYYLVTGKGLPRIDVIGNSRQVDWPRLVQQLIAVTQSEGPVVR